MTAQQIGFLPASRVVRLYSGTNAYVTIGLLSADGTVPTSDDLSQFTWTAIVRKEASSDADDRDSFTMQTSLNAATAVLTLTATATQTKRMEPKRYTLVVYGVLPRNAGQWLAAEMLLDVVDIPSNAQ